MVYGESCSDGTRRRFLRGRRIVILPGQYYDAETGLDYNYHRDYDPQLGRYVQPDPIGLAGGPNPYLYASGNPMRYADPIGLWAARISLELSTINPWTSGGGGSYGFNLEYTSTSGWGFYVYHTPNQSKSGGFLVGPSVQLNAAKGTGEWSGLFNSGAGSYDVVTGGYFETPPGQNEAGYFGLSLGLGKGLPGLGFTTTNYQKLWPAPPKNANSCSRN